jgi:DNA-binding NarL/FixJ family response regulator
MNVLLIDDHALFREGLALLLKPLVDDLAVWEAGSCEEALLLLQSRGAADLVLIDLAMPGLSGLQGITLLREGYPDSPVVALSSSDDRPTVLQALDAGAMGFIPKSSTSSVMVAALKLIMAKGIYLPPAVFLTAPRDAAEFGQPGPGVAATNPPRGPEDLGLTARQIDVLSLILQGKPAKLICRELDLSASTVKAHTSAVLRALHVTTRTQAVVAASERGWRLTR